jgi:hypothetical protein
LKPLLIFQFGPGIDPSVVTDAQSGQSA